MSTPEKTDNRLRVRSFRSTALLFALFPIISVMAQKSSSFPKEQLALNMIYEPLPLGSVRPEGWLQDWARSAAAGITGHLDQRASTFEKGWSGEDFKARGVKEKGTFWPLEQSAYWLDGLVRLAYMLDDKVLITKAKARLDPIVEGVSKGGTTFIHWMPTDVLEQQTASGEGRKNFNSWAHHHMGRALIAYYQAAGDERILDAILKVYLGYPFPEELNWSILNVDPMIDLYRLTGDKRIHNILQDILKKSSFADPVLAWKNGNEPDMHAVVYNEMLRVPALAYAVTGNPRMMDIFDGMLNWHDQNHLLPVGVSSGEEYLAGIGSTRNIETCNVAAAQWTYHWLLRITGRRDFGDRMERIFFNAAPAPVDRDFQTMSYYQCLNRISMKLPDEDYSPSNPSSSSYRFSELGSPVLCCVGNLNRIIPNYIGSMWMQSKDTLAATLYGPCTLKTQMNGTNVSIQSETNYPFEETIQMTISPEKTLEFSIMLRVPQWCASPSVKINSQPVMASVDALGFLTIKRTWTKGDHLVLCLPMTPRVIHGRETPFPDDSYFTQSDRKRALARIKDQYLRNPYACVLYGPLLFALPIPDKTPNEPAPGTRWNYALDLNSHTLSVQVEVLRGPMPTHWHWQLESPLKLRVPATRFDWSANEFQPLPMEPIVGRKADHITLVPYGCTKFRVSMFPVTESMWNSMLTDR